MGMKRCEMTYDLFIPVGVLGKVCFHFSGNLIPWVEYFCAVASLGPSHPGPPLLRQSAGTSAKRRECPFFL